MYKLHIQRKLKLFMSSNMRNLMSIGKEAVQGAMQGENASGPVFLYSVDPNMELNDRVLHGIPNNS